MNDSKVRLVHIIYIFFTKNISSIDKTKKNMKKDRNHGLRFVQNIGLRFVPTPTVETNVWRRINTTK